MPSTTGALGITPMRAFSLEAVYHVDDHLHVFLDLDPQGMPAAVFVGGFNRAPGWAACQVVEEGLHHGDPPVVKNAVFPGWDLHISHYFPQRAFPPLFLEYAGDDISLPTGPAFYCPGDLMALEEGPGAVVHVLEDPVVLGHRGPVGVPADESALLVGAGVVVSVGLA